jgi:hypothetical protein
MTIVRRDAAPHVVHLSAARDKDLGGFLKHNSALIWEDLIQSGAVLFRNFSVSSENSFEDALLSLQGLRPMGCYFMPEYGRSRVEGSSKFVFYTNKFRRTGGTWFIDGIHTENYYSYDVPHFVAFWCKKPSWLGGGTGLVDMAAVYADLDGGLQRRLCDSSFFVSRVNVQLIAARYAVAPEIVEQALEHLRLPILTGTGGRRFAMIFKPSVLEHPITKRAALSANLSLELPGFSSELHRLFANEYSKPGWCLHRFMWNHKTLLTQIKSAGIRDALRVRLRSKSSTAPPAASSTTTDLPAPARLGSAFSADDVHTLAKLVRKYFTDVGWRAGDVILLDNLRVAHTGMPGFGPRELRALLLNPIRLDFSNAASGVQMPAELGREKSVAEFLNAHGDH